MRLLRPRNVVRELEAAVESLSQAAVSCRAAIEGSRLNVDVAAQRAVRISASVDNRVRLRVALRTSLGIASRMAAQLAQRTLDVEVALPNRIVVERVERTVGRLVASLRVKVVDVSVTFAPMGSSVHLSVADGQIGVVARCEMPAELGGRECLLIIGLLPYFDGPSIGLVLARSLRFRAISQHGHFRRAERDLERALRRKVFVFDMPNSPLHDLGGAAIELRGSANILGGTAVLMARLSHSGEYAPMQMSSYCPADQKLAIRFNMHAVGDAYEDAMDAVVGKMQEHNPELKVTKKVRGYVSAGDHAGILFYWELRLHDDDDGVWPVLARVELQAIGAPLAATFTFSWANYFSQKWVEIESARLPITVDAAVLGGWGTEKGAFWAFFV